MNHNEFLRAFEEIIEASPSTLTGSEELKDLANWDSMAMVTLMGTVAEKSGVQLSPRRMGACQTVDDLFALTQTT